MGSATALGWQLTIGLKRSSWQQYEQAQQVWAEGC
jgi:hypothetical protein